MPPFTMLPVLKCYSFFFFVPEQVFPSRFLFLNRYFFHFTHLFAARASVHSTCWSPLFSMASVLGYKRIRIRAIDRNKKSQDSHTMSSLIHRHHAYMHAIIYPFIYRIHSKHSVAVDNGGVRWRVHMIFGRSRRAQSVEEREREIHRRTSLCSIKTFSILY